MPYPGQRTSSDPIPVKKSKTIGIAGSRRRNTHRDYMLCEEAFCRIYNRGDRIVSGGCDKGGDRFAEMIARRYGVTITIHHAHWDGPDGKEAGWSRNSLVAEDCDVLLAVVAEDRKGGTEDTVKKVQRLNKPVILV